MRGSGERGTVLQAYLYRAETMRRGCWHRESAYGCARRIRRGAGGCVSGEARCGCELREADEADAGFSKDGSGVFCGIATHDEAIVRRCCGSPASGELPRAVRVPDAVRRAPRSAAKAARDGFGVRVYIPFGTAWYPYFMRGCRTAGNVVFLARNSSATEHFVRSRRACAREGEGWRRR